MTASGYVSPVSSTSQRRPGSTCRSCRPGLDFICRGIRRMSRDEHVAIERGGMLYDALYSEIAAETKER